MFKKVILLTAVILPLIGFGQNMSKDFDVKVGNEYAVKDARVKDYFHVGNNTAIAVKTQGETVMLISYDEVAMKEKGRKLYEDFPKYMKKQDILQLENKLYYVYEAYNKKAKTFTVYQREIDIKTGLFRAAKTLFTTSKPVVSPFKVGLTATGPGLSFGAGGNKFDVMTSFDKTKILIRYRNKPEVKNDAINKDIIGFQVFDTDFNKVWGKEVKMPHTEKEMNNISYAIDGAGTAFILTKLNEKKSFELVSVNAKGLTHKELGLNKAFSFNGVKLAENKAGNIIGAGYYANGIDYKFGFNGGSLSINVNGLYLFEITKSGETVSTKEYEFTADFIKQYRSKRQKGKADAREEDGKLGINDLVLREFHLDQDGSIITVGEVYYTRNEFYGTNTTDVTHYGNMVLTKINADGSLAWMTKVAKNQAIPADSWLAAKSMGIKYLEGENAHYIMYIDNRKNAELSIDQVPAAHKGGFGGYLTAYKIDDATGKFEKHLILDLTNVQGKKIYQFSPTRIFNVDDNTIMMEYYAKKKQDNMIKMTLK